MKKLKEFLFGALVLGILFPLYAPQIIGIDTQEACLRSISQETHVSVKWWQDHMDGNTGLRLKNKNYVYGIYFRMFDSNYKEYDITELCTFTGETLYVNSTKGWMGNKIDAIQTNTSFPWVWE